MSGTFLTYLTFFLTSAYLKRFLFLQHISNISETRIIETAVYIIVTASV